MSLAGDQAWVVRSNAHGREPLVIDRASVVADSLHALLFGGEPKVTILPGASAVSDSVMLDVPQRLQLSVSAFVAVKMPVTAFHRGGRWRVWLTPGGQTAKVLRARVGDEVVQTTTARMLASGSGMGAHLVG